MDDISPDYFVDQKVYPPAPLLLLARSYADEGLFGAALFYATFVAYLPELDAECCHLAAAGQDLCAYARDAINDDLAARLHGTPVTVNSRNHTVLLEEHSPHWNLYQSLLNKFGADY